MLIPEYSLEEQPNMRVLDLRDKAHYRNSTSLLYVPITENYNNDIGFISIILLCLI